MRIGISMGCPAGVGPDVILLGFEALRTLNVPLVVLGDPRVLEERARLLGVSVPLKEVEEPEEAEPGLLNVMPLSRLKVEPGVPTTEGYEAMATYIKEGVKLCLSKRLSALVTCPVSKEGLFAAGEPYPGHTEMLKALTGAEDVVMCFYGKKLVTSLVTTHIPLREVPSSLSFERIVTVARLSFEFLKRDLGIDSPRMALCALNPHAGEGGLFGDEEERILRPAVRALREEGIPISGPHPADTLFFRAVSGEFHLVVSLYHDQALSPFKVLHFYDGVNLTLGLPIVRTSVDHGTAYELAGTGRAHPGSFTSAVLLALRMAENRCPPPRARVCPEPPCKGRA